MSIERLQPATVTTTHATPVASAIAATRRRGTASTATATSPARIASTTIADPGGTGHRPAPDTWSTTTIALLATSATVARRRVVRRAEPSTSAGARNRRSRANIVG